MARTLFTHLPPRMPTALGIPGIDNRPSLSLSCAEMVAETIACSCRLFSACPEKVLRVVSKSLADTTPSLLTS